MTHSTTAPTVFVGLSGGVDSSVAAARLIKQGYSVVGVFIKVWHPEFMVCNWESERLDAMRVAAHLDIPFLTCDAEAAYKEDVAEYFISEYKAGRTPNPDVMCNQFVKFGRFLEFARAHGADYIATGHYAQRSTSSGTAELHRGIDTNKDQTYFLWTLRQDQLDASLFPVGDTPKHAIRQEAETLGIPVATKKDSQGICFLGQVDIPTFLSEFITLTPGPVCLRDGTVVGEHRGALVYTLGQRQGFSIATHSSSQTPYYVIEKDIERNTLIVDVQPPQTDTSTTITLKDVVLRSQVECGDELHIQTRYRQPPCVATIKSVSPDRIVIHPLEHIDTPASGQSLVFYRGTHCLGGGIIE